MNDYDKGGRYLVKRDPAGFFRWLLANPRVSFQSWIDARRVALPNQNDLTNDLVAAVSSGGALEAVCLELEAEARADALTRLLEYLARLWTEPGGPRSLPVACVSGIVLDLTGRSPARALSLRSSVVPGCHLELTILRRHLMDEKAANLVEKVAAGKLFPWLLPWVPLMQQFRNACVRQSAICPMIATVRTLVYSAGYSRRWRDAGLFGIKSFEGGT